jgi:hypothetical protein
MCFFTAYLRNSPPPPRHPVSFIFFCPSPPQLQRQQKSMAPEPYRACKVYDSSYQPCRRWHKCCKELNTTIFIFYFRGEPVPLLKGNNLKIVKILNANPKPLPKRRLS